MKEFVAGMIGAVVGTLIIWIGTFFMARKSLKEIEVEAVKVAASRLNNE